MVTLIGTKNLSYRGGGGEKTMITLTVNQKNISLGHEGGVRKKTRPHSSQSIIFLWRRHWTKATDTLVAIYNLSSDRSL